MFHLALLDEVFHCTGDVFDGHVRIDAVLIEQVNDAGLQAFERRFGDLLNMRRPTVQSDLFAGGWINFEAKLCGDGHLVTERSERFANEFLVRERAVDFGGIEEGDAAFDCRANQCDAFLLFHGGPVAEAQSHAAQAEG